MTDVRSASLILGNVLLAALAILLGLWRPYRHLYLWPAIALILLLEASFWYFTIDDAYISFRYAQNLVRGYGLVFNPGERVEGYSNFLWVLLLMIPAHAGVDLVVAAKVLGALSGVGTLLVVVRLARWLWPDEPRWAVWAAVFLAVIPSFAVWSVAGLETGLYACLITIACYRHLREVQDTSKWPLSAAIWVLVALTRPEGVLFFAISLMHRLLSGATARRVPLRRTVLYALVFTVPYGLHFLWRLWYYGAPVPNTFYAKVEPGLWIYGIAYIFLFFAPYQWVLMIMTPLSLLARPSTQPAKTARVYLLLMVAAQFGFVICVGGDWMPLSRFLVPIVPLLVLLAVLGIRALCAQVEAPSLARWLILGPAGLLIVHLVLCLGQFLMAQMGTYTYTDGLQRGHVVLAHFLQEREQGQTSACTIALHDAGVIPYMTGVVAIDLGGLTDAYIARHRSSNSEILRYVLAREPKYIVLTSTTTTGPTQGFFAEDDAFQTDPQFVDTYTLVSARDAFRFQGYYLLVFQHRGSPLASQAAPGDVPSRADRTVPACRD